MRKEITAAKLNMDLQFIFPAFQYPGKGDTGKGLAVREITELPPPKKHPVQIRGKIAVRRNQQFRLIALLSGKETAGNGIFIDRYPLIVPNPASHIVTIPESCLIGWRTQMLEILSGILFQRKTLLTLEFEILLITFVHL